MDSNETEIYCVSCGQVCSEKHALKHMEKCFNKVFINKKKTSKILLSLNIYFKS